MQKQDYFVVWINDTLKTLIREHKERYGDEFLCPLRSVEIFQKTSIAFGKPVYRDWRTLSEVKFIFLLNIHDELENFRKNQRFYEFIKTVLGEPPYTEEVFDKWWLIGKAGYYEEIEFLEKMFDEKGLWELVKRSDD